jgi:glycosyltransferase involved in cell wall biosynthesis
VRIIADCRGSQEGFKSHYNRGIGRFIRSVAPRLPVLLPNDEFHFLFDDGYGSADIDIPDNVKSIYIPSRFKLLKRREILRSQVLLPTINRKTRPDIMFFFSHEDASVFCKRYISYIHDLIPYKFPDQYNLNKGFRRRAVKVLLRRLALKSEIIFTNSENSKNDVASIFEIDPEKIHVTYEAVDYDHFYRRPGEEIESIKRKFKLPGRYLLYVGGIDPRKNMKTLLKAFEKAQVHNDQISLVIAGGIENQREYPEFCNLIRELSISEKVILTGFVEDSHLPALYSGASAFILPSLYEGFGIPILEAFACGIPVITARNSSIPEVAGDAAVYCDISETGNLTEAIYRVLSDDEFRAKKIREGLERIKMFDWDKVAARIAEVLKNVRNS